MIKGIRQPGLPNTQLDLILAAEGAVSDMRPAAPPKAASLYDIACMTQH